jgi:hypothetical protein
MRFAKRAATLGVGMGRVIALLLVLAAFATAPASAGASWFPHPADASWTYEWSDSVYSPTPTKEKITVKERRGTSFLLEWTTGDLGNPDDAPCCRGSVAFQEASYGLINQVPPGWESDAPPPHFPKLCAVVSPCGNSLSSTLYMLIWGTQAPLLAEPLVRGTTWAATGGFDGTVASTSRYVGRESVTVPAFPQPVPAAKIRTEITQAGALGDPYGSGIRTVWWVWGVGPVKISFEHSGGADAPVGTAMLLETNQTPLFPPADANYFPMDKGKKFRYRWTNTKHMKRPSVQLFTVEETANRSARLNAAHVSGPIRVAGAYGFALRTDGLTNLFALTQAASLAKFPPLGPRALPRDQRRHFFTPFDLMTYGMNPILTGYPATGDSWTAKRPSRDFSVFGVTGTTRVLGVQRVRVPAGGFSALAVRSTLKQPGFPFGSGTRTSYFAHGKGLVKLVFKHGDGSTSVVQLLR